MSNALIITYSYHHGNTAKVATAMAKALECAVKELEEIAYQDIPSFDLVGLGAGIDSAHHYTPMLEFARKLEKVKGKKAFIFSTSAIMGTGKVKKDHNALREILVEKGYDIIDEFACKGFNTNSFLKYLGGMNKGRPNADDLLNADNFARKLIDAEVKQ